MLAMPFMHEGLSAYAWDTAMISPFDALSTIDVHLLEGLIGQTIVIRYPKSLYANSDVSENGYAIGR